jgi:6-phosphogluconolactonase
VTNISVTVLPTHDALVTVAADRFVALAAAAIRAYGRFHVALSGGTTPKGVYQMLATERYAARVDWSRVHLFWGDERCVPPRHPMSNYRMVRETLIAHVTLPADHVHRVRGEDDPGAAAAAYERELRNVFRIPAGPPMPGAGFDLVLLGLGLDGHTASLFPGLTAVSEQERWVTAAYVAEVSMWRVTCTPVVFNTAAQVVFLVVGPGKAAMLRQVLEGPHRPALLPAQVIAPSDGSVCWLVDADAGATLTQAGAP